MTRKLRWLPLIAGLLTLALATPACGSEPRDPHPPSASGSGAASATPSAVAPATRTTIAPRSGLPSERVWLGDVRRAMAGSRAYLDRRVARGGGRLAVVLDIDNTSIASHYAWPKPVRLVRAFAGKAHRLGVTIFIATGRSRSNIANARRALTRAGYHFRSICTRRTGESLQRGKLRCRKRFERHGYTIIADVGNRPTDFWHGHFERRFKLPDYGGRLA